MLTLFTIRRRNVVYISNFQHLKCKNSINMVKVLVKINSTEFTMEINLKIFNNKLDNKLSSSLLNEIS